MSRPPCCASNWPSAVTPLRPSTMSALPDTLWRPTQGIFFANRPKNQIWNPSHGIRFAKAAITSRLVSLPSSLACRGFHTSEEHRSSQTTAFAKMNYEAAPVSARAKPRGIKRDWDDIADAEAFEPLRSFSKPSLSRDTSAISAAESEEAAVSQEIAPLQEKSELDDVPLKELEEELEEEPDISSAAPVVKPEPKAVEDEELPEEPLIKRTYFLDQAKLREATRTSKSLPDSYWRYTMYSNPAGQHPVVHYCTTAAAVERVTEHFLDEPVLGFDLEWNPGARVGDPWYELVSVMQIASQSHIAIFHLSEAARQECHGENGSLHSDPADVDPSAILSPNLVQLLGDPNILKTGVWVSGDCTRVRQSCGVDVRGQLELSHLYNLVKCGEAGRWADVKKSPVSMAAQCLDVLKLPIFKDKDVRTSQWSRKLGRDQILYAASDAYAGLQLFMDLDERRLAIVPRPPRPSLAELKRAIALPPSVMAEFKRRAQARAQAEAKVKADAEAVARKVIDPDAEAVLAEIETADGGAEGGVKAKELGERASLKDEATKFGNEWLEGRAPPAKYVIPIQHLRCYFLWHQKTMEAKRVGEILGLKPVTVQGYILSAVWKGKLPHEKQRLDQIPRPRWIAGDSR